MTKLSTSLCVSLFFFSNLLPSQVIFSETFNESGTTGTSAEGISWSCTSVCNPTGIFASNGSSLVCNNPKEPATWSTETIDVSGVLEVSLEIDFEVVDDIEGACNLGASCECSAVSSHGSPECGTVSNFDFIDFGYILDGGITTVFPDELGCSSDLIICDPACGSGPFSSCDVSGGGIHTYYGDCLTTGIVDDLDMNNGISPASFNFTKVIDVSSSSTLELSFTMINSSADEIFRIASVTVTATLLPIELSSFEGILNENKADLYWTTLSEINNSHFEIEHALNNTKFRTVGTIKGTGNSYEKSNYYFTHLYPQNGSNYYRLKQVDFDGRISYSDIITIEFNKNGIYQLFPNPAKEKVYLLLPFSEITSTIQVLDITGKCVMEMTNSPGITEYSFEVGYLPPGQYITRIVYNRAVESLRFSKQ